MNRSRARQTFVLEAGDPFPSTKALAESVREMYRFEDPKRLTFPGSTGLTWWEIRRVQKGRDARVFEFSRISTREEAVKLTWGEVGHAILSCGNPAILLRSLGWDVQDGWEPERAGPAGRRVGGLDSSMLGDVRTLEILFMSKYLLETPGLQAVVDDQARRGLAKYGCTIEDNDSPLSERVIGGLQEAVDLVVYAVWASKASEGEVSRELRGIASDAAVLARRLEALTSKSDDLTRRDPREQPWNG